MLSYKNQRPKVAPAIQTSATNQYTGAGARNMARSTHKFLNSEIRLSIAFSPLR